MAFVRLEFSYDDDYGHALTGASVQTGDHSTPPSPNVKIGNINGRLFLNKFYAGKPITLRTKSGEEFQLDIEEIINNFFDGEDELLYLIFDGYDDDDLCAVWEYYDEEEIYRNYKVVDICSIHKFEMMIAAEEDLFDIDAPSIKSKFDTRSVRGSLVLEYYKSIDDDNADDKSEL